MAFSSSCLSAESRGGLSDVSAQSSSSGVGGLNGGGGGEPEIIDWRTRIDGSMARSRKVRGGNFVQIATVDPETGSPRCRTVVLRGFLPLSPPDEDSADGAKAGSSVMKMITDLRSAKVSEATAAAGIGVSENVELVWWFGKSSEQYRVRGDLRFVGGGTFPNDADPFFVRARREQWGNLSDSAREQFFWRDPLTAYEAQIDVPPGGRDGEGGKVLPPPDNFLLMLLYPRSVDYLRLGDNFRQTDTLDDGRWTMMRVNP